MLATVPTQVGYSSTVNFLGIGILQFYILYIKCYTGFDFLEEVHFVLVEEKQNIFR